MDKTSAIKLVQDTFQKPFKKEQFILFTKNLLNKIDESKAFSKLSGTYIKEMFREYVNSYERIGTYTDSEGKNIDILIVYLQKESSIERARTAQRNFAARYLKDRDEKDAGLIAFVSPNPEDWRFSLVKMEYKFTETPSGKVKAKEEFTPAKRFSFLVGENESSHTAQSKLVPFLENDNFNPTLKDLEEAFNIEKVTKEFFEKYRALFLEVKETIDEVVKEDKAIREDFSEKGVDTVDFSKKLMGQIVFLYFLQKKGWFGVEKNSAWGTGSKRFLRDLFDKKVISYNNFFNDVLEPLFYDALARDRSDIDHYNELFKSKIPFLNGGLFDPINNYDWVNTDILLPDEMFSNKVKTKEGDDGTGILDIFDRYNFTVKEDEPLEKEVAVDPEMLGKVFENLLEVKDRKSKGTYYTPREIVHYMCQESLINYLSTELSGCNSHESGNLIPSKEEIEILIRHGESAIEHDARVEQKGKETRDYPYKIPEKIRTCAELIDEKLTNIRVCDPAVGSGAFLVGMMNEIVRARTVLTSYPTLRDEGEAISKQSRSIYDFKRNAIQNCLYGVDIDPGAVEIAKLRLWLSLVVDEEDIKQIKPLPNLDYKIMQGNSLLEEYEGIKLFDESMITTSHDDDQTQIDGIKAKQSELQKEYFQLNSENKLSVIKKQKIETELNNLNNVLKKLIKGAKTDDKPGLFDYLSEAKKKSDELKQLHKDIFNVTQKSQKDELRKKIEKLEWDLIEATLKEQKKESSLKKLEQFKKSNTRPFFLWKLHFSEVFLSEAKSTSGGQEKGGFDIVIANPPYVQLQKNNGELADLYKDKGFQTFERTGDIYALFYEKGFQLLKAKGIHSFITSSQWMKAGYGRSLRRYFLTQNLLKLILLGPGVFDNAVVDTDILIALKERNQNALWGILINELHEIETLNQISMQKMNYLTEELWTLLSPIKQQLKEKIEKKGKKLKEWDIQIYRGVLTGYNEAFIIDKNKRNELVKQDSKSAEIIKPILRGREIDKYYTGWDGGYILFLPWHFPLDDDENIQGASEKAEKVFKKDYPIIYKYLTEHKEGLKKRNKDETGIRYEWYALQRCAATYKDEFKKEKIIWKRIGSQLRFSYYDEEIFCLDSTCIATGEKIKYLTALLNSKLCNYQLFENAPKTGMGDLIISVQALEPLYVYYPNGIEEKRIVSIFDRIIPMIKSDNYKNNSDKQAKVKEYENQINNIVYELYGLTEDEINIVKENDY